ncbi:hypothetical protein SAMN05444159_0136 [Bradyrhizobium lablabi]|uniref:Uncharacterized protein n=2 Tax=Bradyrhizobium lablabi TaxID=722472 RepID=A0A1M6HX41_9BRAD|nr:hypothetical protein SAMN05444159_0136 [Bradyrhizobium lablabi]
MGWFGWRSARERGSAARATDAAAGDLSGPMAILEAMDQAAPKYLDRVDRGEVVYPACKRTPSDADGNLRAIWEHTRIEAMRYLIMVPGRKDEWLIDPARQAEMLDAFLRKAPHENTVIDFTGIVTEDFAIAIIAGLNWLIHCAVLAGVDRKKFSGTQSSFRKIAVVARRWWALEGSEPRCYHMLAQREKPPLMLYLIWLEYTRLAKEITATAVFGASMGQTRDSNLFRRALGDRRAEPDAVPAAVSDAMARLERAGDPEELQG